MPLSYNAKDAKGLALPKGIYEATLSFVKDTTAKSTGADMQVWTFSVYHTDGIDRKVFQNVTTKMAFMIKKLAKALGKLEDFEAGTFQADDYIGKNVRLALRFVDDPQYGEKNEIDDILPKAATVAANNPTPAGAPVRQQRQPVATGNPILSDGPGHFTDDDIPF